MSIGRQLGGCVTLLLPAASRLIGHGDLRPQRPTKWPPITRRFPPAHPVSVCHERQKALLALDQFSTTGIEFVGLQGGIDTSTRAGQKTLAVEGSEDTIFPRRHER